MGLCEVLEGSPASVVAPGDSASLSTAIVENLTNSEARKLDFIAFQKHAVEYYQIYRPASELRKLYQQVYDGASGQK